MKGIYVVEKAIAMQKKKDRKMADSGASI